ncbi:MAG: DUF4091 domain-containing protein [Verrucomicrobia bacterium]|nr:DUF4091 domain-containing protein [Verrucomicrobiota bacterium]
MNSKLAIRLACLVFLPSWVVSDSSSATVRTRNYGYEAVHDAHGVIAPWYRRLNGQCDLRVRIAGETFWATGESLLPAWGFYGNGSEYGGTKPSGKFSAWTAGGGAHRLTWVAEFPSDGGWQVWVRRYGGYGNVTVEIDEKAVAGGKGGPGGGRYVWKHIGPANVPRGRHHVDITVTGTMLDAVLFTSDGALHPEKVSLPDPVKEPAIRALRVYRDDAGLRAASRNGFVVGALTAEEEVLHDWLPAPDRPIKRVKFWGAANQYVTASFAIRALDAADELTASVSELAGPGGTKFVERDLRVVHVRERLVALFTHKRARTLTPELLLKDDRTTLPPKGRQGGFGGASCVTRIPAHQSRQFWLTVRVPAGAPPGTYSGTITLTVAGSAGRTLALPVELEVLPINLLPSEGYYSIYYPLQPVKTDRPNYVKPERYRAELEDMVRHGLNSATLYGGFDTLRMAREAGMTKAPCLMHWPGGNASQQIAEAKAIGFDDLLYYGVDEPNTPEAIERCRKEAERRRRLGLHMMTAINSRPAQEATRDFIDRPVYNLYVFGGPNNAAATYVREKGFYPISYWTTSVPFPLWHRGMAGLYNTACGYLGTAPWAYQDFPDDRLYNPDKPPHVVSYPDADGQPIPTLCWEAMRDGIDDVRYLEALDRAIRQAEERLGKADPPVGLADALAKAREVRKRRFENITGRWFQYLCGLHAGDLAAARRELADATVVLSNALRSK